MAAPALGTRMATAAPPTTTSTRMACAALSATFSTSTGCAAPAAVGFRVCLYPAFHFSVLVCLPALPRTHLSSSSLASSPPPDNHILPLRCLSDVSDGVLRLQWTCVACARELQSRWTLTAFAAALYPLLTTCAARRLSLVSLSVLFPHTSPSDKPMCVLSVFAPRRLRLPADHARTRLLPSVCCEGMHS